MSRSFVCFYFIFYVVRVPGRGSEHRTSYGVLRTVVRLSSALTAALRPGTRVGTVISTRIARNRPAYYPTYMYLFLFIPDIQCQVAEMVVGFTAKGLDRTGSRLAGLSSSPPPVSMPASCVCGPCAGR